jgi:hypothetical protein
MTVEIAEIPVFFSMKAPQAQLFGSLLTSLVYMFDLSYNNMSIAYSFDKDTKQNVGQTCHEVSLHIIDNFWKCLDSIRHEYATFPLI